MQDRIPEPGKEGRVKITPENGSPAFFAKMEMADNPLVIGTPLSKGTLLSDEIAEGFGLNPHDATVRDILYYVTAPRLFVTTTISGASITVTGPGFSQTKTASGLTASFNLPGYGTYTAVAKSGGQTSISAEVVVDSVKIIKANAPFLNATFSNNDWETIAAACHSGSVPSSWAVGNYKNMDIGGTSYRVDIIGKSHDVYTAGGTAPLTFQLHDCLNAKQQMNSSNTNVGGWKGCAMRSTHLPAIFETLPPEVRAGIRKVNKKTSAGYKSATIETSSDALFLLSEVEIFGKRSNSKPGEGSQYAYYQAGNSRVKKVSGAAGFWWERSPYGSNATHFCTVTDDGTAASADAYAVFGVAFGFCF